MIDKEMRFLLPEEEYERAVKLYKQSKTPLKRTGYFRKIFLQGLILMEEENDERS
jgi:hypothetical protein